MSVDSSLAVLPPSRPVCCWSGYGSTHLFTFAHRVRVGCNRVPALLVVTMPMLRWARRCRRRLAWRQAVERTADPLETVDRLLARRLAGRRLMLHRANTWGPDDLASARAVVLNMGTEHRSRPPAPSSGS